MAIIAWFGNRNIGRRRLRRRRGRLSRDIIIKGGIKDRDNKAAGGRGTLRPHPKAGICSNNRGDMDIVRRGRISRETPRGILRRLIITEADNMLFLHRLVCPEFGVSDGSREFTAYVCKSNARLGSAHATCSDGDR